ncbi:hypothetical protein [Roseimaritima ulvae]|uniref:Acetoacetate decarboxylase (ADC) n=1 Tax=Roseimaritima ulvae TaxID=980254 RepID=A0A5B9QXV3_9BACT|nr:hypothetical protein [Roseimaritima ulvae]QEG42709.1 hypothetical protein UC8_47510 [Roseimaritima ulvae]
MTLIRNFSFAVFCLAGTLASWQTAVAQDSKLPEVRVESTRFAPGTVTAIPPQPTAEETFTGPITLRDFIAAHPEIAWKAPEFPDGRPHSDPRTRTLPEMAQQVILRREVYCLEFSFKPLRQIYVDVPQPNNRMQRKLIWYMVFRVRYLGGDLRAAEDSTTDSPYGRIEAISYKSRRFIPLVVLANQATGKEYLDRILPAVKSKIAMREKITAPLYNTVEISAVPIPRSTDPAAPGVWGLATWEDVDPNIDFFSVFVSGLTNAFERQEDTEGNVTFLKKTLQLNFYRPGDSVRQTEDEIRFGIPAYTDPEEQAYILQQYGVDKRLDYQWVYR